jgi:hypothetical protein
MSFRRKSEAVLMHRCTYIWNAGQRRAENTANGAIATISEYDSSWNPYRHIADTNSIPISVRQTEREMER